MDGVRRVGCMLIGADTIFLDIPGERGRGLPFRPSYLDLTNSEFGLI